MGYQDYQDDVDSVVLSKHDIEQMMNRLLMELQRMSRQLERIADQLGA